MTEKEFIERKHKFPISRPVNSMRVYEAMRDFYSKERGVSVEDYNPGAIIIRYYKPQHDIHATVESQDNKTAKIIIRVPKADLETTPRAIIDDRCDIIERKLEEILTKANDNLH